MHRHQPAHQRHATDAPAVGHFCSQHTDVANVALPAAGVAQTGAPLPMSGVDSATLTRRILTDNTGRLIMSAQSYFSQQAIPAPAVASTASIATVLTGFTNQIPLNTQDTSQFEGQTQIEILAQLLLEMKILNQQIYELPRVLTNALQGSSVQVSAPIIQPGDEPAQMRIDNTLFDKQQ